MSAISCFKDLIHERVSHYRDIASSALTTAPIFLRNSKDLFDGMKANFPIENLCILGAVATQTLCSRVVDLGTSVILGSSSLEEEKTGVLGSLGLALTAGAITLCAIQVINQLASRGDLSTRSKQIQIISSSLLMASIAPKIGGATVLTSCTTPAILASLLFCFEVQDQPISSLRIPFWALVFGTGLFKQTSELLGLAFPLATLTALIIHQLAVPVLQNRTRDLLFNRQTTYVWTEAYSIVALSRGTPALALGALTFSLMRPNVEMVRHAYAVLKTSIVAYPCLQIDEITFPNGRRKISLPGLPKPMEPFAIKHFEYGGKFPFYTGTIATFLENRKIEQIKSWANHAKRILHEVNPNLPKVLIEKIVSFVDESKFSTLNLSRGNNQLSNKGAKTLMDLLTS